MAEKAEEQGGILYLNDRNLKKIDKNPGSKPRELILDNNLLSRLDNVDTYDCIQKLSAVNNDLIRMYGVAKLTNLRILDLSDNNIVCIEGLKELLHLTWLNLASNNIKSIDHLNTNVYLDYLNLSDNNITHLSDISYLKSLKTLLLFKNKISTLRFASNYISASLNIFSVSENNLTDINEVSYLSGLSALEQLSINNNPCFVMTGENVGFDYRPFVINWCLQLRILDGYLVGPKESLKAEWLYSQGKGRHFRPGEHDRTVNYLSQVCPMTGTDDLQTEEDAKLAHILNKQKQHQIQLLEELSKPPQPMTSPLMTRSLGARLDQSPSPSLKRKPIRRLSPKSFGGSTKGGKQSPYEYSNSLPNRYSVELPAGLYVLDVENNARTGSTNDVDQISRPLSLFTKTGNVKSSKMAANLVVENLSGSSTQRMDGLETESQYVPVPESMLSPDFRPVTTSPSSMYQLYNGEIPRPTSARDSTARSRRIKYSPKSPVNLSRSPVNQGTASNRAETNKNERSSSSHTLVPQNSQGSPVRQQPDKKIGSFQSSGKPDLNASPFLRRTAALRKITKQRMLGAVQPRRQMLAQKMMNLDSASSADSMSENESTDSEMSLSKLALVKEIAASRKSRKTTTAVQRPKISVTEKESLELSEKKGKLGRETDANKINRNEKSITKLKSKQMPTSVSQSMLEKKEKNEEVEATEKAATVIQAAWKGFRARELDSKVKKMKETVRQSRTDDHITHLTLELNRTKQELEHERQLRSLQIDTIRALWKEVQLLQQVNSESVSAASFSARGSSLNDLSINSPIYQSDINQLFATRLAEEKRGRRLSECETAMSQPQTKEIPKIMSQSMPASSNELTDDHTSVTVKQLARKCEDLTSQVQHLHEALQVMSSIVFSPRGSTSHQCYDPMTRSTSSEISGCSCPSIFNNLIGQQMDSIEACAAFPPSMVSSVISTESNTDFDSQADGGIISSFKFSPELNDQTGDDTLEEKLDKDSAVTEIAESTVKTPVDQSQETQTMEKVQRTSPSGNKPLGSKIGANIPGLRDRSRHEDSFQSGDVGWSNSPQPQSTETAENEDECVITVQVMQTQVYEIQEVKVDRSPKTPETSLPSLDHSGQGDDVKPGTN